MKIIISFLKKFTTLIPFSSTFLLALLVKSGVTQIDPNIIVKATPK